MLRISHPDLFDVQKISKNQKLSAMNSLNTHKVSASVNKSETEINHEILEVFRQAKEIIEHYSNKQAQKKINL